MTKILILRFSSIGDIVLATPAIRCIAKQVQGAEVHIATKPQFASILEANPYIGKVHTLPKDLSTLVAELKAERFDYIIDLHHNLRTSIIKARLGVKSYSFNKLNVKKFLITTFKINRLPDKHIVDRYIETASKLGVVNDGLGLDYFIRSAGEVDLQLLPVEFRNGYIGFVIGAKHATKRLPLERMIKLCMNIDYPVILLGGKEDSEIAGQIVTACKKPIYNACGKFNLDQSASLVKQANVVISHDTGLMHIAAAYNKKILSIWGNTIPEFGMYPYLPAPESQIFEVKGLSCRPCSKIGYNKCPKKHFACMNEIDITALANRANHLY
jgi:ADP-heptose:LPS heptosyltransferase